MNLDELEAKARELQKLGSAIQAEQTTMAVDVDTILHLIARVRAGEDLARSSWEHRCSDGVGGCTAVSASALERLESLADSPQEAV